MAWAGANPGMAGGPMGGFGPGPAAAGIGGLGGFGVGGPGNTGNSGAVGGVASGIGGVGIGGPGNTGNSGAVGGVASSGLGGLAGLGGLGGYGGGYAGGGPTGGSGADYGGASSATGGVPGGISGPTGGLNGGYGSDGGYGVPGAAGTAHSSNRGDYGGRSIGQFGGPPSSTMPGFLPGMESIGEMLGITAPRGHSTQASDGGLLGSIGMAAMGPIAAAVHGWGRGQSEHSMNSSSSQGFASPGQTAMQDAIAAARGPGARGRAEAAALGDPRGQSPSGVRGGVPSDINSRAGMNSADYMGLLPDATQASLGGYPAGTAANRGRKGDFAGVRGHATAQDPGPRGMPAPDFAGPRHSSPTPSPVAQDQGFDVRADFGPVADTVFGGLRDARDAFRGMESRAGFQRGRVGGVGGGGVDPGLLGTLGRRANFNDPTSRGR